MKLHIAQISYMKNLPLQKHGRITGSTAKLLINNVKRALKAIKQDVKINSIPYTYSLRLERELEKMIDRFHKFDFIEAIDYNLDVQTSLHLTLEHMKLNNCPHGYDIKYARTVCKKCKVELKK